MKLRVKFALEDEQGNAITWWYPPIPLAEPGQHVELSFDVDLSEV